jgi:hypothetical protein
MGRGDLCTGFLWGNPRNGDHFEDTNVDERIILRWIFMEWDRSVDWVELAQDRDRWRAVLNEGLTLRVP